MRGCATSGSPVVISRSDNLKRKYAWSLEMVQEQGVWIGIHTGRTNNLVHEALQRGSDHRFWYNYPDYPRGEGLGEKPARLLY